MYQRNLQQRKFRLSILTANPLSVQVNSVEALRKLFDNSFLDDLEIDYTPNDFSNYPWNVGRLEPSPWSEAFAS